MKIALTLTAAIFLALALPAFAEANEGFLRYYLIGGPLEKEALQKEGGPTTPPPGTQPVGDQLWFSPGISLDFFSIELGSRIWAAGVTPGVGYGLKWKPNWWTATSCFLALDLFLQANIVETTDAHDGLDYFKLDLFPILTVIDWVGIGIGPRFMIALDKDLPDDTEWVFSFGLRTSI